MSGDSERLYGHEIRGVIVFGEYAPGKPYVRIECSACENKELFDIIGTSLEFVDDEPTGSLVFYPGEDMRVELYVRGLPL